jgi:hypothetical protein
LWHFNFWSHYKKFVRTEEPVARSGRGVPATNLGWSWSGSLVPTVKRISDECMVAELFGNRFKSRSDMAPARSTSRNKNTCCLRDFDEEIKLCKNEQKQHAAQFLYMSA